MSTNNESSFGARLKNATDCVSRIRGFNNYTPPRTEESVEALTELTAMAEGLNREVALRKSTYKTEVINRQNLFNGNNASLEKLLSPISKAVGAQYGKNSDESRQVASIIRRMRATRIEKAPATEGANGEAEVKNSRSQRSFGSIAQQFKDLSNTVSAFNGFSPSNTNINVETLVNLAEQINTSNNAVSVAFQQKNNAQNERNAVYADLSERIQRVKLYVASHYGNGSSEYKIISKLKV